MATKNIKPFKDKDFQLPKGLNADKYIHLEVSNFEITYDDEGEPSKKTITNTICLQSNSIRQFAENYKAAGATKIKTLFDPSGEDSFQKVLNEIMEKELKSLEQENPMSTNTKKRIEKIKKALGK